MTNELEELQNIAVSILRTDKITVILDNTLETACTDFKNIYITTNLVPPELLKYNRVVSRLLDGEVAHEAAHILKTAPLGIQLEKWKERQGNRQLANYVYNCVEDKRGNHYIFLSYRHDYAYRLRLLDDVTNRLWIDTLKAKIAKKRNSVTAWALKPESFFIESMLISIAGMMSHDAEVEKYFDFNPEQKTFIQKTKNILDEACFAQMVMSVVNLHQQLYDLWNKQISKSYDDTKENTPASMGGNLKLESGQLSKKAMAQKEKALKEAEQKLEEELKKENKQKEDLQQGMGAGSGSGLNIPTPEPDENEYQHLAQRNSEHIQKLLNLLKRLAMPIMKNERFTSEGRFMNEVLGKAYASSMRRNIREIYAKKTITLEKAEACIGLLVDLSGSVNLEDAKDSLTVIAEVCGQWLRDEDFAIMVFGCVPPETEVYSPNINLATAKYYKGKMIEITTKSKRLLLTPTHPVLTKNGWKMAKDINHNDNVFVIEGEVFEVDNRGHRISEGELLQAISGSDSQTIETLSDGGLPVRTKKSNATKTDKDVDARRSEISQRELCIDKPTATSTKIEAQIIHDFSESEESGIIEDGALHAKLQEWKNPRIQFLRARNSILSRNNRWRRKLLHFPTQRPSDTIPSPSNFKYIYFANEMASREDKPDICRRQEDEKKLQKTVVFSHERMVPSTTTSEIATLLDNQERTLPIANSVYTKPIREMCFPAFEPRGVQHHIKNPHIKQERIAEIKEISYDGLVYNLETQSNTYWANGILVHNSDYQKIKAYVEPYHTTKLRIGGIDDMGGTVLYEPLNEMFQMMKAQRNNRAEILMIVSDFSVTEPQKCQKLIKTIEENGINVIGLGINNTTEEYIRYFCQQAKYIGNIRELPEAVFELYQEVAF